MTTEELSEIKDKYIEIKQKYKKLEKLKNIKNELEKYDIVQKYLNVLDEINELKEVRNLSKDELFKYALLCVQKDEESNIYVSTGDGIHYVDIEKTSIIKLVDRKEALEFEIFPYGKKTGTDFLDYVREKYYKIAIRYGKEKALEYIMEKSNKKISD